MDIIEERAVWRIYWYDDTQTILVGEVTDRWTWQNAYEAFSSINPIIRANPGIVNTILWFTTPVTRIVPRNANFALMYRLMNDDVPNEDLFIMVSAPKLLEVLFITVMRTYKMVGLMSSYRYVETFDDALKMIETHCNTGRDKA